MGITYLKCKHNNLVKDCLQCKIEKQNNTALIYDALKTIEEDKRIPIYRGCSAAEQGGCFCTGACREIVGYQD